MEAVPSCVLHPLSNNGRPGHCRLFLPENLIKSNLRSLQVDKLALCVHASSPGPCDPMMATPSLGPSLCRYLCCWSLAGANLSVSAATKPCDPACLRHLWACRRSLDLGQQEKVLELVMDGQVVAKGLQRRKQGRSDLIRVIDIYDADGRLLSHERAGGDSIHPKSPLTHPRGKEGWICQVA